MVLSIFIHSEIKRCAKETDKTVSRLGQLSKLRHYFEVLTEFFFVPDIQGFLENCEREFFLFWDSFAQNIKAVRSFETSRTIYPTTQFQQI
jgi:hypothetical protein